MANELHKHTETINNIFIMLNFFQSLKLGECEKDRRAYFNSIDNTSFINLIQIIAGLIRNKTDEKIVFDGEYIYSAGLNPFPNDKEECINKSWSVARKFLNDPNISDIESLVYAGITISNGIVLTHPFNDGNGRLSRIISYLIIRGIPDKEYFKSVLLQHSGGMKESWNLDSSNKFKIFDKEFFDGFQPDTIIISKYYVDSDKIKIDEGIVRTLIEQYKNDTKFKSLMRQYLVNNEGSIELHATEFMEALVNIMKDDEIEFFAKRTERIEHYNTVRGFLNAMLSNRSILDNGKTYYSASDIAYAYFPEEVIAREKTMNLLVDLTSNPDSIISSETINIAIANLPLRSQLYLERSKQVNALIFNDKISTKHIM